MYHTSETATIPMYGYKKDWNSHMWVYDFCAKEMMIRDVALPVKNVLMFLGFTYFLLAVYIICFR